MYISWPGFRCFTRRFLVEQLSARFSVANNNNSDDNHDNDDCGRDLIRPRTATLRAARWVTSPRHATVLRAAALDFKSFYTAVHTRVCMRAVHYRRRRGVMLLKDNVRLFAPRQQPLRSTSISPPPPAALSVGTSYQGPRPPSPPPRNIIKYIIVIMILMFLDSGGKVGI